MAIISKEVAQRHLEMWLEAEAAVSTGQSYQIEQMQLNRARNRMYHFSPHDV